jgi:hypothetical protein
MRQVEQPANSVIMKYMMPQGFELKIGPKYIIVPSKYYGRFWFGLIVESEWKSPDFNYSILMNAYEKARRMKKVTIYVPHYCFLKYNLKASSGILPNEHDIGDELEYKIPPDNRFAIHFCREHHVSHNKIMRVGQLGCGRVEEPLWAFKERLQLIDDPRLDFITKDTLEETEELVE